MQLNVGGSIFLVSPEIYNTLESRMCMPGYIDRNPICFPIILDYMRGYTFSSFSSFNTGYDESMLWDDMRFYGLLDKLRAENELLYHKLAEHPSPETFTEAERTQHLIDFKEYITPYIMKGVDAGLSLWKSKLENPINTSSLRSQISDRIRNDNEFLLQLYEFADIVKHVPVLSVVVDSTRMFIVNYFLHT